MTQFSNERSAPKPRFKPGPGQLGQAAALKGMGGRSQGPGKPQKTSQKADPRSQNGSLGPPSAPASEKQPADYRHILALAQHQNMVGLGRDIPFGIWAINTGLWREILPPGQIPYDVLEHGDQPD